MEWVGNQKHYQANRACPGFHELQRLVEKTLLAGAPAERKPEPAREAVPPAGPATPPKDDWKVW